MRRLTTFLTTAVLAAAGCGGDDDSSGSESTEKVALDYVTALGEKDRAGACELQTASSQEGDTCDLHSRNQLIPKSPEAEAPVVSGDRANVLVTGPNASVTLNLVMEGGEWKVEEYQGQAIP